MATQQQPGVVQLVHYVSPGTSPRADGTYDFGLECRAAIITETARGSEVYRDRDTVGLCVLYPADEFFLPLAHGGSAYSEGTGAADWSCDGRDHEPGTWHWPGCAT